MGVTRVEISERSRSSLPAEDVAKRSNLTRAQFLIWLGQQLDPDVPLYNMIQTFRINGALDTEAFARAWSGVVAASDALHCVIRMEHDVPMSTPSAAVSGLVEVVDLRDRDNSEEALEEWIAARKQRPIAIDQQLWDTALLLVEDDVVVWYLCMHHLITDGQSFALTYAAVHARYMNEVGHPGEATASLPRYAERAHYERSLQETASWERANEYWKSQFEEEYGDTEFYGRSVSHSTTRTDRVIVEVGKERSRRIRELAHSREFASISDELSLNTIWACVLFTTIHRITGRTSLRVGTPFLGRLTPSDRDTIGLFIEIGVLNIDLEADETFATLGAKVLRRIIKGVRYAQPGVSSAELNRSYDVLLNNVTSRFEQFAGHDVATNWVHTGHGDRDHAFRLQISDFDEHGSFRLHFDVNTELFGDVERHWLLQQFDTVLDALLDDPTRTLGSFTLASAEEQDRTLIDFNSTDVHYPSGTIGDLFADQVRRTPTATAIVDAKRSVTYQELADEVRAITACLLSHGVKRGDLVAIYSRRSVCAVASILGALQAGAAYVPIDPAYPENRRRLMLEDSDPVAVLVAGLDLETLEGLEGIDVPVIDVSKIGTAPAEPTPPPHPLHQDDLAYVIYTSGSTGRPKGTELTHRGLMNYVCWAKRTYQSDAPLDFALYSSLSFDLTITSIFVPIVSGGRVVVYDQRGEREGLEILDVFEDDQVDVVKLTPAHLTLLLESGARAERISHLIVGGENFRTDLANRAVTMFGHGVKIFNEYGPTETVVGCMVHRFNTATDTGPSVPIGAPAGNARIYVLDGYDQPVPAGVIGEIVIGGDGVGRGYRNHPELTADRFGADRFRDDARWYRSGDLARWGADGRLEFLGRDDDQVKIRGARIELGEIESALLTHNSVESVLVDVVTFGEGRSAPITHCTVCGLPSNYPGSKFDGLGICGDCRSFEVHRHDVDRYFGTPDQLQAALDLARSQNADRPYDCIVLVSGGKDSTYMLYQLVREHGVRPLVFTLDNGYIAATALDNVRAACEDLGVDLHVGSTPHMNAIFADSLDRHANVCDGCYKTIYTMSMSLAREHGVETIVTGLSRGQLFETRLADTFASGEFDPERIDSWVMEARKAYHHIDDAVYQHLETDLFNDDHIFDSIRFIDFYRYIDVGLDEVYRYLHGETIWMRPADTGRSTNCLINDVGIYVHNRQRGYHNYALPYSWDVRLGHKQREAAMDELEDDLDIHRVGEILNDIGRGQLLDELRNEKRIVAYYTTTSHAGAGDLRAHLSQSIPEFMVPTYFVRLDALPLTTNGKIDRAALPDPRGTHQAAARYRDPSTETERRLVEAWRHALRVPTVGVDDNFFELGGDSITSIQIVAALRQFGWPISARDVFVHQTIAELATVADNLRRANPNVGEDTAGLDFVDQRDLDRVQEQLKSSGTVDNVEDVYPLTATQQGMLYHTLRSSASAYFGQATCRFMGEVDGVRLQEAWVEVCNRHPATRVRFVWKSLDQPVQVVQREVTLPWTEIDWTGRTSAECSVAMEELLRQQRRDGIDIAGDLLMNLTLVRTDRESHLIWNSHHALLDGWSAHMLFGEVMQAYLQAGLDTVPLTTPPFRDHVASQSQRDTTEATQWWRRNLAGVDTATSIPFDNESNRGDESQDHLTRVFPPDFAGRLNQYARDQRVTPSAVANAAWALVLARLGRSTDVLFGVTSSGRENSVAHADEMVGMFINTLPTRVQVNGETTVGEWLRSIQADSADSRRHGHLALADLQRLTAIPSTRPLFDSIVAFENYPASSGTSDSHPLQPESLNISAPSNFPLALLVYPSDEFKVEAVFEADRFDANDVDRLLSYFQQALSALLGDAGRRIRELDILSPSETLQLEAWSVGPSVERRDETVVELISHQATELPAATAIIDAEGSTTYAELVERANQFASLLQSTGVNRGDRVGVLIGTSADHVAALLGTLRLGGVYVPIDGALPLARLASIQDQADIAAFIAPDDFEAPDGRTTVVRFSASIEIPSEALPPAPTASDLAYVLYTSGSTGEPKGVAVSHGNIAHSTAVRADVYGDAPETFLLLSSMAFDSSMVGLLWTLTTGGTLVMSNDQERRQLGAIASLVERHGATHLLALPSLYGALIEEHDATRFESLRVAIVAGEPCPRSLAQLHAKRCAAKLYNEYGPTEATVWSHVHQLGAQATSVPIGRPIPNTVGLVLDPHDRLAAIGAPGELVIGGDGVAEGYFGRPDLTDHAFVQLEAFQDLGERWYRTGDLVQWTQTGALEFIGRIDDQVKIRGYRVELGDIDAVLLTDEGVRDAVTVAVPGSDAVERYRLVAYVVGDASVEGLRERLRTSLPDYMVPTSIFTVEDLPVTSTGKVDRTAVRELAIQYQAQNPTVRRPLTTETEWAVAEVWADVLGSATIGPDENFFDLGGNSLDAMRAFARIERMTGRELLISTLLEAPTVAQLAAMLDDGPAASSRSSCLVPIKRSGSGNPLYYVAPYEISVLELSKIGKHVASNRPMFGLQPSGLLDGEPIHETIEEMAADYIDAIRAHQPAGPYALGGHCDGAWVAHEMARQLLDQGADVGYLAMVDVSPPADHVPRATGGRRIARRVRYYARDRRLIAALRWQAKLRIENALLLRFGSAASRRVRAVRSAHEAAFNRYDFEHDQRAPLHLIRSTELAVTMDEIPWYDTLVQRDRDVVVTDINSTHARLLREPETVELAEVICRQIEVSNAR